MSEKETHDAAVEAQREITTHPERTLPHLDTIGRLVASVAYAVAHDRPSQADERDRHDEAPAQ